MTSLPHPSRDIFLGAIAALATVSISVGRASAQSPTVASTSIAVAPDFVSAAIAEASRRFGVPEQWIRSVMHVESAGDMRAVSHAGALGLMQVMPATYAQLRLRYGLGPDPFDVRDNILAGAAYLREMHDRYGIQGMLAAYNAGPARWEAYVRAGRRLPQETIAYLAQLASALDANIVTMPAAHSVLRASEARLPSLFVQLGSASAAVKTDVARSAVAVSTAVRSIAVEQLDSVFVQRQTGSSASFDARLSVADRALAVPATPTVNPLFVPVRSSRSGT